MQFLKELPVQCKAFKKINIALFKATWTWNMGFSNSAWVGWLSVGNFTAALLATM